MGPKKSAHDSAKEPTDFSAVLPKLCKQNDVLIIPVVTTLLLDYQIKPPDVGSRHGKESKKAASEKSGTSAPPPTVIEDDDVASSLPLPPPEIQVVYENPEEKESPLRVFCKKMYVEYALIQTVIKCLGQFPTLTCLKIEDCCISDDIVESLALLLSEDPGRNIRDLSLDGNAGLQQSLPLLLRYQTAIKWLSLRRCSLNDEGISLLAAELTYSEEHESKLQVLNLNMNRIGDKGAQALAEALRTNRNLVSLSLAGNEITDEGAEYLADVLGRFPLTHDEVTLRRRKVYDSILHRRSLLEKFIEDWRTWSETESLSSKTDAKNSERSVHKPKLIESKTKAGSRDRRKRSASKINISEKFRSKLKLTGNEDDQRTLPEPNSTEMLELLQQVENGLPIDKHPHMTEVKPEDGYLWCEGSWRIGHLNLAHNNLKGLTLEKFTKVVKYQDGWLKTPQRGLVRLVIQPGNQISVDSSEYKDLQLAMQARLARKDGSLDSQNSALSRNSIRRPSPGSRSSRKKL